MHIKRFIMLIVIFLLTGCSVVRINTSNFDTTVNVVLSKDNKLYNQVGKGYKYFIPKGVSYIESDELNDILYTNGNYYYLYVDVISYYYNIEQQYTNNKDYYYYKDITMKDGFSHNGYVSVEQIDTNYFYVDFMYNYAKFESIVSREHLEQTILDASYILSTIKYNDVVISLMLDDDYITDKEEKYDIFETKDTNSNKFQIRTNIEEG